MLGKISPLYEVVSCNRGECMICIFIYQRTEELAIQKKRKSEELMCMVTTALQSALYYLSNLVKQRCGLLWLLLSFFNGGAYGHLKFIIKY